MPSIHYPRGGTALAVATLALATALVWPGVATAAVPIIECNAMTVGQPCDTDNTVCTQERCVMVGASVECRATGNAPPGTACESDSEPCTIDACSAAMCRHTALPEGTVCFDGLFCTDGETCNSGVCGGGKPTCDDHDMCSSDVCDEDTNTCSHPETTVCADDGNACTSDACDPLAGCNYKPEPVTTVCDDALFCTLADHCDGQGACIGTLNCLDVNVCTIDSCDENNDTCVHTADPGALCDDANACTTGDRCAADMTCAGTPVPDSTACSAGGGCLTGGTCSAGVCSGSTPAPNGSACNDGDECNVGEACMGGTCQGGAPRDCGASDSCTIVGCDPGEGCVTMPVPDCADAGPGPGRPDAGPGGPDAGPSDGGVAALYGDLGGGGCGCDVGGRHAGGGRGSAAALVLAALAALVCLRRGRLRRGAALALTLGLLLLLPAPPARAGGFDAQLFKPAASTTGFISQEGPDVLPPGFLHVRLTLDVATDLLVLRDPATDMVLPNGKVLSSRTGMTLGAAYGLGTRLELSASLPLALVQNGNLEQLNRTDQLASTALGDLRLGAKLRLLRSGAFGLAGAASFIVPTGDDSAFAGAGTMVFTPRLIAGLRAGRASLGLNVGYALRKPGGAGNLEVDDEIVFGAGARIDLQERRLWLLGEGYSRVGVQGHGTERELPVEVLFALRWQVSGPWALEAGAGFGVTRGYGTPGVREFLGLAWAPLPPARVVASSNTDVSVEEDVPPPEPPPPPPPKDSDGDGLPDERDACPNEAEDVDGVQDEDGCPDPDRDGDGILDADDKCPDQPEVMNGVDDTDGCPDQGLFELKEDRIVLEERVLFDTERARVKSRGKRILKAVVVLWNQHPEYDHMIVEGHTDERGSDEYNQNLGQLRAERVKKALVEQGFPEDKIEIVNFGRSRPVDTSGTEAAWQKNRRSEFVIIKKTKVEVPAPAPAPAPPAPDAPQH